MAIAGAFVGGSIGEGEGLFYGIVLGALLAQVLHLRSRTQTLAQRLQALEQRGVPSAAIDSHRAAPSATVSVAAPERSPVAVTEPVAEAHLPEPEPPVPLPHTPPSEPTIVDRLVQRAIAWGKSGNPLARIGIVILFFGGAFLAKYAADHSLFPIELRFLLIALGAFALLFVGWRLRERRRVYAETLQGGGIAGLYLTVFAATKFDLLPLGLAFGLMVLIALAGAVLAVAQNALSLAVIATTGGFLAPILVSTGKGSHIALFTYYALLNLGVFAVAWFRTWRALNLVGFFFTFTITSVWRVAAYTPANLVSADAFLVIFFLMYLAVSILSCVRQEPDLKGYVSGSLVFGLPVVAFALHASLVYRIEYALAWSALALGLFYLALGWTLFKSGRPTFGLLVEVFAALGIIFASLAIPLAFDTKTTAAMWAVEGAGLLWLGVRQQRKLARAFGAVLQAAAGVGYLWKFQTAVTPILNGAFIGAAMIGLAGFFSSYWLYRNRTREASYERGAHAVLAFWATAWWLLAGLQEVGRFLDETLVGGSLAHVAFTAALMTVVGTRLQWPVPRWLALYLPAVTAFIALLLSIDLPHPFVQWGAAGWLALLAAHGWILRQRDEQSENDAHTGPVEWLHAGTVWVLALLLAAEIAWHVRQHTIGVWDVLPWGVVPAVLLALLGRRALAPAWPLARHEHSYRVYGGTPLAIGTCAWILLANVTQRGDADWLPYVPLLNPLDVGVALTLAAVALWWTSLPAATQARWLQGRAKLFAAGIAALVFIWLNAALLRALHHGWGAPLSPHGLMTSMLVQASLSIFWGLLGFTAMTVAAKRQWRIVWLVGAGLMAIVVLKLFAIDLAKSGTLATIASFLTVGALLLITGYLAPLPPRRAQEAPRS